MGNIKDNLYISNQSTIIDLSHSSEIMIIAFGAMGNIDSGEAPFEFIKTLKNLNVSKVFLRDINRSWYHTGMYEISEDIEGTVSFLKEQINRSAAKRVICIGNSMGGYAALLFGILLKVDYILTFAPQTSLKKIDLIMSKQQIKHVHNHFSNTYFDINEVLTTYLNTSSIHIYYDPSIARDKVHAMHISRHSNVYLHKCDGLGHILHCSLMKTGEFQLILFRLMNPTLLNTIVKYYNKVYYFFSKIFNTYKGGCTCS